MINIRTLRKIPNGGGLTLKDGKPVQYKTGYQVGIVGTTTSDITKVRELVKQYKGNCGLWFSAGIWFVDYSRRFASKASALAIGRANNQQTIYDWKNDKLIEC